MVGRRDADASIGQVGPRGRRPARQGGLDDRHRQHNNRVCDQRPVLVDAEPLGRKPWYWAMVLRVCPTDLSTSRPDRDYRDKEPDPERTAVRDRRRNQHRRRPRYDASTQRRRIAAAEDELAHLIHAVAAGVRVATLSAPEQGRTVRHSPMSKRTHSPSPAPNVGRKSATPASLPAAIDIVGAIRRPAD